jgi:uncharacterized protein with gpF-like domain
MDFTIKFFNSAVNNYEDIFISYHLYDYIESKRKENYKVIKEIEKNKNSVNYSKNELKIIDFKFLQYTSFNFLAAFSFTFTSLKIGDKKLNSLIIKDIKHKKEIISKHYEYIKNQTYALVKEKEKSRNFSSLKYFKSDFNSTIELEDFLSKGLNQKKDLNF